LHHFHFTIKHKLHMARPKKPLTPAQQIEQLSIQLAELDIELQAHKHENDKMQQLVKKLGQNATDHQYLSNQLMHQRDRLLIATVEIQNECTNSIVDTKTVGMINKIATQALKVAKTLYIND